MPGTRVCVIVSGNDLPEQGTYFSAYKTALRELGVKTTPSERLKDRKQLRTGASVIREGFTFVLAPGGTAT